MTINVINKTAPRDIKKLIPIISEFAVILIKQR